LARASAQLPLSSHFCASPYSPKGSPMSDSRKEKLHDFVEKADPIITQVDDYATTTFGWFKPIAYVIAAALVLKYILN